MSATYTEIKPIEQDFGVFGSIYYAIAADLISSQNKESKQYAYLTGVHAAYEIIDQNKLSINDRKWDCAIEICLAVNPNEVKKILQYLCSKVHIFSRHLYPLFLAFPMMSRILEKKHGTLPNNLALQPEIFSEFIRRFSEYDIEYVQIEPRRWIICLHYQYLRIPLMYASISDAIGPDMWCQSFARLLNPDGLAKTSSQIAASSSLARVLRDVKGCTWFADQPVFIDYTKTTPDTAAFNDPDTINTLYNQCSQIYNRATDYELDALHSYLGNNYTEINFATMVANVFGRDVGSTQIKEYIDQLRSLIKAEKKINSGVIHLFRISNKSVFQSKPIDFFNIGEKIRLPSFTSTSYAPNKSLLDLVSVPTMMMFHFIVSHKSYGLLTVVPKPATGSECEVILLDGVECKIVERQYLVYDMPKNIRIQRLTVVLVPVNDQVAMAYATEYLARARQGVAHQNVVEELKAWSTTTPEYKSFPFSTDSFIEQLKASEVNENDVKEPKALPTTNQNVVKEPKALPTTNQNVVKEPKALPTTNQNVVKESKALPTTKPTYESFPFSVASFIEQLKTSNMDEDDVEDDVEDDNYNYDDSPDYEMKGGTVSAGPMTIVFQDAQFVQNRINPCDVFASYLSYENVNNYINLPAPINYCNYLDPKILELYPRFKEIYNVANTIDRVESIDRENNNRVESVDRKNNNRVESTDLVVKKENFISQNERPTVLGEQVIAVLGGYLQSPASIVCAIILVVFISGILYVITMHSSTLAQPPEYLTNNMAIGYIR